MMKIRTILLSSLATVMLFACETGGEEKDKTKKTDQKVSKSPEEEQKKKKNKPELTVVMESKSDSNAEGNIKLKEKDGKVFMKVEMKGLTTGEHAIHIHEKGDCSADDGTSAGGHWNPTEDKHGKWGKHEFHMGDIGNLVADKKGKVSFEFETEKWCIGCDDKTKNIIGKSFIVHAGPDDFESQPSGDAGARVACGVIEM